MNETSYDLSKEGLANALAKLLGTTVVAQYMAHGYHWNVKGPEFTQFHAFFDAIYSDWSGEEDRIAEYIRILGFDAPFALEQFAMLSCVEAKPSAGDPIEMSANLYEANLVLLNCAEDIFNIATAINNQGIANWAAERMDAHSKWNWQIGTTIGADAMQIQTLPGKSKAESLLEAMDVPADAVVEIQPVQATAGSKPAPKKDQIKGSDKNKEGSASGSKKITFSKSVEESLRNKVKEHNDSVDTPSKKVSLSKLKAVYRRGAGAFSSSHRPDQNRNSWAMARVNAFLHLVKSGSPKNPEYTTDNDLLPPSHPKKSVTASGDNNFDSIYAESLLTVEIKSPESYQTPEDAIYAFTEFSGLGYEAMPVFRAAWKRGVNDGEDPFTRAADLAINLYESKDADLLPKQEKE